MASYSPNVSAQIRELEEKIKALKAENGRTTKLDRDIWNNLRDAGMERYKSTFERYVSWVALTAFGKVRYQVRGSGMWNERNKRLNELTDDEHRLYKACVREIAESVIKYSKEAKEKC